MGLLAGVFGDGRVHILDVREEWIGSEAETVNISVTEAAWEFDVGKEVMATCVTWKSHTDIVIGCSNGPSSFRDTLTSGFAAIFDLRDETDDRISHAGGELIVGAIPSFYTPVSDTYILSVASLAPSHPHFIAVSSFDGSIHVMDIRSPESDTVHVLRQRGHTF